MDPEAVDLCNAINALPGMKTTESCCGHGKYPFIVFFRIGVSDQGMFFLARCQDNRYWKFGDRWSIKTSVADVTDDGSLPLTFCLESLDKGKVAYDQANDLIRNMNYHLIKGYNLDLSKFLFKD